MLCAGHWRKVRNTLKYEGVLREIWTALGTFLRLFVVLRNWLIVRRNFLGKDLFVPCYFLRPLRRGALQWVSGTYSAAVRMALSGEANHCFSSFVEIASANLARALWDFRGRMDGTIWCGHTHCFSYFMFKGIALYFSWKSVVFFSLGHGWDDQLRGARFGELPNLSGTRAFFQASKGLFARVF